MFDVFSFPLIAGDPKTALVKPRSMVISQQVAERFFGDQDPIGKTLMWDNTFPYLVTDVMRDVPQNTHWRMEVLASLITMQESEFVEENRTYSTYVMRRQGVDHDEQGFVLALKGEAASARVWVPVTGSSYYCCHRNRCRAARGNAVDSLRHD